MDERFQKIAVRKSFAKGEEDDLFEDAKLSWQERMRNAEEMKRKIWIFRNGEYPEKIEKFGVLKRKSETDQDDF